MLFSGFTASSDGSNLASLTRALELHVKLTGLWEVE